MEKDILEPITETIPEALENALHTLDALHENLDIVRRIGKPIREDSHVVGIYADSLETCFKAGKAARRIIQAVRDKMEGEKDA